MNLRRVRAIARKESLHILRDPRSLVMALALPAVMLILFGYALTLDVDRIPIVVLDREQSPSSRELLSRFEGSRFFTVLESVDSYAAIERVIDRGGCLGAIVVPPDFTRNLDRGKETKVQLILDGSDSNTALIALGYAEAIVGGYASSLIEEKLTRRLGTTPPPGVRVETRVWYNSSLQSRNYIVPGLLAVILMLIAALLTSLTIAREWEMGTMEQLLSTPVRPSELVLGKMLAYFGLGAVDTVSAIVLGAVLFSVPIRGSLALLAVSCFVFLFGALCWGILLSAFARSQLLAYQMGMLSSFLPAFLLSGFIFAIDNMPFPVQMVTYLVPARYFISLLRGLFLKGVGLEYVGLELLLLLVFAVVVFAAATLRLRGKVA